MSALFPTTWVLPDIKSKKEKEKIKIVAKTLTDAGDNPRCKRDRAFLEHQFGALPTCLVGIHTRAVMYR